jgi:hypothetical protein
VKKSVTVTAIAAVLAVSGCGNQTLVGPGAIDPAPTPVGPEEARKAAHDVQAELESGGGSGGGGH